MADQDAASCLTRRSFLRGLGAVAPLAIATPIFAAVSEPFTPIPIPVQVPAKEAMAAVAVQHRDKIFSRVRAAATANLAALDEFFARLSSVLGWVRPRGGMTAFPWLINQSDSRAFCQRAAERGILLAPGDCFEMPQHLRLGFAATETGFNDALAELEDLIKGEIPAAAQKRA